MKTFFWGLARIVIFALPMVITTHPDLANLTIGSVGYALVRFLEYKFAPGA